VVAVRCLTERRCNMANKKIKQRAEVTNGATDRRAAGARGRRRATRLAIRYIITQDNFNTPEDPWMVPVLIQADATERPDGHEDFEAAQAELIEEFDILIEEEGGDPDDEHDYEVKTYLDCLLQKRGDSQDGEDWDDYCCCVSQPSVFIGDRLLNLADLAQRRVFEVERAEGYPTARDDQQRATAEWMYSAIMHSLDLMPARV
jgi:hypothetical protein